MYTTPIFILFSKLIYLPLLFPIIAWTFVLLHRIVHLPVRGPVSVGELRPHRHQEEVGQIAQLEGEQ